MVQKDVIFTPCICDATSAVVFTLSVCVCTLRKKNVDIMWTFHAHTQRFLYFPDRINAENSCGLPWEIQCGLPTRNNRHLTDNENKILIRKSFSMSKVKSAHRRKTIDSMWNTNACHSLSKIYIIAMISLVECGLPLQQVNGKMDRLDFWHGHEVKVTRSKNVLLGISMEWFLEIIDEDAQEVTEEYDCTDQ